MNSAAGRSPHLKKIERLKAHKAIFKTYQDAPLEAQGERTETGRAREQSLSVVKHIEWHILMDSFQAHIMKWGRERGFQKPWIPR